MRFREEKSQKKTIGLLGIIPALTAVQILSSDKEDVKNRKNLNK